MDAEEKKQALRQQKLKLLAACRRYWIAKKLSAQDRTNTEFSANFKAEQNKMNEAIEVLMRLEES